MNQVARRLGKTFALVLPVVLVLSGTLAVTRVPWAASSSDAQVLTASATKDAATPQEALRRRLLAELQEKDPGVALTDLQVAMAKQPSLARYCVSIARSLGRAAVAKYDGAAQRAQAWSRPVCDTAFATGVSSVG
ncbi:hypothetical protein GA0115240_152340 [Streptomyces sp. DvalAA-14]|uniref:hypothetical protein n=1 Tax=unclassified Streptomyces TaxID=2593676 RepID=UPI00081B3CD4|nr:hypothetical protein [Streptomyces sp. DvalAA-14]MYS23398.1 hypothetical protein [Streptomyces sp. SID4948]SCE32644.1 hypothetical protein GA0115240_152340 [Streptomyces sp. DvalAA-14]